MLNESAGQGQGHSEYITASFLSVPTLSELNLFETTNKII